MTNFTVFKCASTHHSSKPLNNQTIKGIERRGFGRRERKKDEPLDDEEQPLNVLPALQKYTP
jgi:hypothetical protein